MSRTRSALATSSLLPESLDRGVDTVRAEGQRLYQSALDADAEYGAVIQWVTAGDRDRWTLTRVELAHPQIVAAYNRKLRADDAILSWMRQHPIY